MRRIVAVVDGKRPGADGLFCTDLSHVSTGGKVLLLFRSCLGEYFPCGIDNDNAIRANEPEMNDAGLKLHMYSILELDFGTTHLKRELLEVAHRFRSQRARGVHVDLTPT